MSEKIIFEDSPEAVRKELREVYFSADGRAFFDEHTARYVSSTHKKCNNCGNVTEKYRTLCDKCVSEKNDEKYNALQFKEWDKKTPVVLFGSDLYFCELSEIEDYCEENGLSFSDLQLCICKPNKPWELDSSIYEDLFPGDADFDYDFPDLNRLFDEFNEKLKKLDLTLSWSQGKYRTSIVEIATNPNPDNIPTSTSQSC